MNISPFDNHNKPIIDVGDSLVPLTYFNIVKLEKGQAFSYRTPGYETCIVPATGQVDVEVEGERYAGIGQRARRREQQPRQRPHKRRRKGAQNRQRPVF